jgi:hypothetical protein
VAFLQSTYDRREHKGQDYGEGKRDQDFTAKIQTHDHHGNRDEHQQPGRVHGLVRRNQGRRDQKPDLFGWIARACSFERFGSEIFQSEANAFAASSTARF